MRHPASTLRICETQLRGGPRVTIVDLSVGGVLLEADTPLAPDREQIIKLVSATANCEMHVRVVRSYLSQIRDQPRYRCACIFHHPLALTHFVVGEGRRPAASRHPDGRLDRQLHFDRQLHASLQKALQPSRRRLSRDVHVPLTVEEAATLTESFGRVCRLNASEPSARSIAQLLTSAASTLRQPARQADILSFVEAHLREALPRLASRFEDSPTNIHRTDAEFIYFQVPFDADGTSPILSVGLPRGFRLEEWQFRLLRASTYVAALLKAVSDAHLLSSNQERRRHARVTGPFDAQWMAVIDMPVLIIDLSEKGCLISSFQTPETGLRLSLEIQLPGEGVVVLTAETVGNRPHFGFAARFIENSEGAVASLRRFMAKRIDARPQARYLPTPA